MRIVLKVFYGASFRLQFIRCIESNVGFTCFEKFIHVFAVYLLAFTLAIRTMRSTKTHPLVKLDTQPSERFDDILFSTRNKALRVGIFNSKNEIATMLTSEEIVIECSTHTANM